MKRKQPKVKRPKASARKNKESWIRGIKDADLKKLLARQAKTNPGAAPRSNGRKGKKLKAGFIFLRPVCNGPDCPGGPDPDDPSDDPCSGQNFVWYPDIAAQIKTFAACPSADVLTKLEQGIRRNLSPFQLPDPDVRVNCKNGTINIKVWRSRVQPNSCNDLARQRAPDDDLSEGAPFGLFISASLVRKMASDAFQVAPKTFDENGVPNPYGPFHLTGLSVGFKPPHTIETYITGYDERPLPDIQFTQTLSDKLTVAGGFTPTATTDFSWLSQAIAFLELAILALAVPLVIPFAAFVLFKDLNAALNVPDNPNEGGVGARLQQALPQKIALPQIGNILSPRVVSARRSGARRTPPHLAYLRQNLTIGYAQPTVDDRGLFVIAGTGRAARIPSVRLDGPTRLSIYSTAGATFGNFNATPDDFFGNLSFNWSSSSNVLVQSQGQARTKISFRRGSARAGDSFERTVTVRVTDEEGSSVTASRTVSIYVNEPDDNIPPICQTKPWLPECFPRHP